ncbi:MAG: hemolysin family protein [Bacillota bacterium]|nr:hemolysin family protein [Bacillota bacterium]
MEDPLLRQLLLLLLLIAVNAFFAAAEIAFISLNGNKLRKEAEEGDKKSARVLRVVEKPGSFLSTIQIGITLAGFLASAFAADSFSDRLVDWMIERVGFTLLSPAALDTLAVIVITLILSYVTLVFGELVPKRIALLKSARVAAMAASVIGFFAVIFKPLVWLTSASTDGVLKLFGINPDAESEAVTESEIRMMVDIGEEKGAIEPQEAEMIENIFEFNNQTAGDVMIHRKDMKVLWLDDTPEEIISLIAESGLSRFPVCGEDIDDIVGIIRTKEFLLNAHLEQPKPLRELLAPAYFVPETVMADKLFRDMQQKKTHLAIVVDEYGGTAGLVTLEDLLEEIVGNIYDEFDPTDTLEIIRLEDNLWRVAGAAEIDYVAAELQIELPEDEEFDTMSGLIIAALQEIPADDSHPELDAFGLHIRVERILDRRIEWALVSILPPADDTAAADSTGDEQD